MVAQVFVSYARKDESFVLKLAQDLRQRGVDLWIDQLDIGEGRWDDQVQAALETCPCFLIVLSPSSVQSQNVKDEIDFALYKRKTIVPVVYQNCEPPFRIRRFQHVDFHDNYDSALIRLFDLLPVSSKTLRPKLILEFFPKPEKVSLGNEVVWGVRLRNTGAGALHDVNVRRGQKLLHPIFNLHAASEKVITFTATYNVKGSHTESVTATGVDHDGQILQREAKAAVQVSQPVFSKVTKRVVKLVEKAKNLWGNALQPTTIFRFMVVLATILIIAGGVYFKGLIVEISQEVMTGIGPVSGAKYWEGNIAFSSNRDGNWEIYTLKSEENPSRLTNNGFLDRYPAWSPDGSQLAFVSNRDGNWEIYRLDAGGVAVRMTNHSSADRDPTWSPDGSLLTFVSFRDGNGEIYMLDAASGLTRLTNNPAEDREPDWSPDSSKLAFASNRDGNWDIYTLNAAGKTSRLTQNSARDREPDWSPDGSKLAFASDRDGNWEIYVLDSEGRAIRLTNNPAEDREPGWSPDGSSLVFYSDRAGSGRDIYMLASDGHTNQLTTSGADENPNWAP